MDVYSTEEEQVEAIRKWWRENGKAAVFGVVLGLSAIFGWRAWQSNIISTAEAASELFENSLVAMSQNDRETARDNANRIINEYTSTGYVVFARLLLAFMEVQDSNYSVAEEHLRLALDAADNETLRTEITLRLARVSIANNKLDQALGLLNGIQPGKFASQFNELKGDIYALQGKGEEARTAYQLALSESAGSAFDPSMINLKLNSLD